MHTRTLGIIVLILLFQISTANLSNYNQILKEIKNNQLKLRDAYIGASPNTQDSLLQVARTYITTKLVKDIFPAWYGTPWDFYGTTYWPKKGKIACGYFVTTTLVHCGFKIPRYKWAQLAAENIIKKFTQKKSIKRLSNAKIKTFRSFIIAQGKGLYVVGLTCHVGFVYYDGHNIWFIHSNYYKPDIGVMAEKYNSENPLKNSYYRVFGKLFDDRMVRSWILGERFIGYTH